MNLINLIIEGIPQKDNHVLEVNKSLLIFKIVIEFPFQLFSIIFSQFAFLSAKGNDILIFIDKPNFVMIIFSTFLKTLNIIFDKISELLRKTVQTIDYIFPKYYQHTQLQSKITK